VAKWISYMERLWFVELYSVGLCLFRIVPKIEEYREFFTAFHEVMLELMSLLS